MRVYRQTFRRHRPLLIAPVVVATLIAGWFTFGAPPAYRSSASLWVDNGPSISSSVSGATEGTGPAASATQIDPSSGGAGSPTSATPVQTGPAGLEAQVVYELLLSPSFDLTVGRGSLLPRFLASGGSAAGFSPSFLPAGRSGAVPSRMADAAAAALYAPRVTAWAAGPQVLELSYNGPSPEVSRSVLQSLIRQLGATGSVFGDTIGKTASSFYRKRLAAASAEVAGNQGSLTVYGRQHPGANAGNDATYRALTAEVRLADEQRAAVQTASSQANTEAASNGGSATIKVIDPPTLPAGPVTGLPSKLTGVVGGAFAGVVMSLLALILLTPRGQVRWDAEVPVFARLAAWDATGRRRRGSSASPRAARAPRRGQEPPAQPERA